MRCTARRPIGAWLRKYTLLSSLVSVAPVLQAYVCLTTPSLLSSPTSTSGLRLPCCCPLLCFRPMFALLLIPFFPPPNTHKHTYTHIPHMFCLFLLPAFLSTMYARSSPRTPRNTQMQQRGGQPRRALATCHACASALALRTASLAARVAASLAAAMRWCGHGGLRSACACALLVLHALCWPFAANAEALSGNAGDEDAEQEVGARGRPRCRVESWLPACFHVRYTLSQSQNLQFEGHNPH